MFSKKPVIEAILTTTLLGVSLELLKHFLPLNRFPTQYKSLKDLQDCNTYITLLIFIVYLYDLHSLAKHK